MFLYGKMYSDGTMYSDRGVVSPEQPRLEESSCRLRLLESKHVTQGPHC